MFFRKASFLKVSRWELIKLGEVAIKLHTASSLTLRHQCPLKEKDWAEEGEGAGRQREGRVGFLEEAQWRPLQWKTPRQLCGSLMLCSGIHLNKPPLFPAPSKRGEQPTEHKRCWFHRGSKPQQPQQGESEEGREDSSSLLADVPSESACLQ